MSHEYITNVDCLNELCLTAVYPLNYKGKYTMPRVRKQHNSKELSVLMNNVCSKLKQIRKESGLSQNQLARKSGVALSTINEIENHVVTDVKLSTVCQLAKTLKRLPITLLIDSDMNLSDPDKRDFHKAFSELEQAFEVFGRIHQRLK